MAEISRAESIPGEYQLYYFDAKGLAEPIRYILSHNKIPFTDHRVPVSSMVSPVVPPEIKKLCRFGQLPILKINSKNLIVSQSKAIARHLAKEFDMMGQNDAENVLCEEFVEGAFDLWSLWTATLNVEDEERKLKLREIAQEKGQLYLTAFNTQLQEQETKVKGKVNPIFLINLNGKLTWADIYVAHVIDNIQKCFQINLVSNFPLLFEFILNVFATPAINEYIEERIETPF